MNYTQIRDLLNSDDFAPNGIIDLIDSVHRLWQGESESSRSLDLIVRLASRREEIDSSLAGAGKLIDDVVRFAGLYPYLDKDGDSENRFVRKCMSLPQIEGIVFHKGQIEALGQLLNGKSLVLSAPTSFGKSLLVDTIIRVKAFNKVLIVVPTLSLLDEYRKRLKVSFPEYDVLTRSNDKPARSRIIYLGTQERIEARHDIDHVDLFVIDEFYKLDLRRGDERSASLNSVMARYASQAKQIYLLGPSIDYINSDEVTGVSLPFMKSRFSPVATDVIRRHVPAEARNAELVGLLAELQGEPTIVYFRSPNSISKFSVENVEEFPQNRTRRRQRVSDWVRESYHPDWILADCLAQGIGIHHGRIPRALGQYEIHLFNKGGIDVLFCTSSLIEGVNTRAKNVVIYDNYIRSDKLDRFTFDNIKGRAGRMFKHFVGRVFLFSDAPLGGGVGVAIPFLNGFENASDDVLLSVPMEALSPSAARRRKRIVERSPLSEVLLTRWGRFGVAGLESLADEILDRSDDPLIAWSGQGNFDEIQALFELAWNHLIFGRHELRSGRAAAFFTSRLRSAGTIGQFMRGIANDADNLKKQHEIDRCLNFLRAAEFTLPQVIMAINDVAREMSVRDADYSTLSARMPLWFAKRNYAELEEYGVPFSVAQRYDIHMREGQTFEQLDVDLSRIRNPVELDMLKANLQA